MNLSGFARGTDRARRLLGRLHSEMKCERAEFIVPCKTGMVLSEIARKNDTSKQLFIK